MIQLDQPKVRRSSTMRSSRSRAGSVSGGTSGIIGSIFGAPTVRQESPEKIRVPKKRLVWQRPILNATLNELTSATGSNVSYVWETSHPPKLPN